MIASARPLALLLVALVAPAVGAQPYPNRPVRMIVPWPAGQSTDLAARIVAERMAANLRQPVVVDNKPGAGGTLGTEAAIKAAADGYTVLAASSGPISVSPHVQKVGYEPARDLEPVCQMGGTPFFLVVHPSMPVATTAEFVALLRAQPGKFTFGSSGTGSTGHLIAELFKAMARVDAVHVPYKGSSQAVTDLIGGHVNFSFESSASVVPHVRAGKLKVLAVTSAKHSLVLPDVPTVAESAPLPGFDMRSWSGLLVPAGTPRETRALLAAECQKAMTAAGTREQFLAMGIEPAYNGSAEFAEFMKQQSDRYGAIARQARVRVD